MFIILPSPQTFFFSVLTNFLNWISFLCVFFAWVALSFLALYWEIELFFTSQMSDSFIIFDVWTHTHAHPTVPLICNVLL